MNTKTCISYNKIVYKTDDWYIVEMLPRDSHVSFYGKAHALFTPFYTALFSYKTPILVYKIGTNDAPSEFIRLYDGGYVTERHYWDMIIPEYIDKVSPTTLRHIRAFCGMNKKEFLALPYDRDTVEAICQQMYNDTDGEIAKWSVYRS